MAGDRNPDIQRLLASLRTGSPLASSEISSSRGKDVRDNPSDQSLPSNLVARSIPGLGMLQPSEYKDQSIASSKSSTPRPALIPPQPESSLSRPATPAIPDASTITTWPAALKHLTRHIITNEKAVEKIKRLISEQGKHEQQWWAGREAIVARHSGRAGNQAKVADLLKSLGGASIPVAAHDPKADQAELDAYDKKVYKSLTDMTADFDRRLRGLQIPFFAIKHELVILGDSTSKEGETKGKIDRGELRELQRRIIETLQDLCADD